MANSRWPSWLFGKGLSSHTNFLHLSRSNIEKISELTSPSEPLNPHQCRSMLCKLKRTMGSVVHMVNSVDSVDEMSLLCRSAALENFYRVSEKARQLVEDCCRADWWQASAFQIQNEEAFREVLLEAGLSYNTIFQVVEDVSKKSKKEFICVDLRETTTFDPAGADEVSKDRVALQERLNGLVNDADSSVRCRWLAWYLLERVNYVIEHSPDDCDLRYFDEWARPDGEWGAAEHLGRSVYKTTWLDVPCAKKVFDDEVFEMEWLAEAKILASLNHPNIVKFLCCNKYSTENGSGLFIAMEQMDSSLATFIKRLRESKAKLSFFQALDVILQIAYGLCYLHDHGVAHRDLKTSNVVVRKVVDPHLQYKLEVKLADFGISKAMLKAGKSNTITRPRIGTTVYMPPEAFTNGRADWFKADTYSFSVMCSVILSCHEPFQHVKSIRDVYKVVSGGQRPELPGDTPKELADLIKEGWATDRQLRPSFIYICSRLERLRHGLILRDHATSIHFRPRDVGSRLSRGSNSYIDGMLKKRHVTRERDWSHARVQTLNNVMGQEECFDGDEEQETIGEVQPTTLQQQERHGVSTSSGANESTEATAPVELYNVAYSSPSAGALPPPSSPGEKTSLVYMTTYSPITSISAPSATAPKVYGKDSAFRGVPFIPDGRQSQWSNPGLWNLMDCVCIKNRQKRTDGARKRYTLAQVMQATKNYERKLGQGGFGPVYYGQLRIGEELQEVAVKVAAKDSGQGSKQFINEIELLTRVHHKHLVSLVGYCDEGKNMILIYEYVRKGSLDKHLYGLRGKKRASFLDWPTRLQIALQAAQGLEYLHVGCNPAIFHCDIKSNNILLDDKMVAKVADFGISMSTNSEDTVTHISCTHVMGTLGYLDPEYYQTCRLTDKSDVYSFGMVLLELICARPPILPDDNLINVMRPYIQAEEIEKIVDKDLQGQYNPECMWKVAVLAMRSLEPLSIHRPKMSEVVQELREAASMERSAGNNSSTSVHNSYVGGRSADFDQFDIMQHESSNGMSFHGSDISAPSSAHSKRPPRGR